MSNSNELDMRIRHFVYKHFAQTACPPTAMETAVLTITNGQLQPGNGVIHFPLPVQQWYDDLILT